MAFSADQVQIRDDAPDRYDVVLGDTLWDILGRIFGRSLALARSVGA